MASYFKNILTRMTLGQRVITIYFLLFYIVPLLGNFVFKNSITSSYKIYDVNFHTISLLLIVYSSYHLLVNKVNFEKIICRVKFIRKIIFAFANWYSCYSTIVALICCALSVYGVLIGFNKYRYIYDSISSGNSIFMLIIVANAIATIDLFLSIFTNSYKHIPTKILYCLTLIFSISGVGSCFASITLIYSFLFNDSFKKLFFVKVVGFNKNLLKILALCMFIVFNLTFSILVGESIKISTNNLNRTIIVEKKTNVNLKNKISPKRSFINFEPCLFFKAYYLADNTYGKAYDIIEKFASKNLIDVFRNKINNIKEAIFNKSADKKDEDLEGISKNNPIYIFLDRLKQATKMDANQLSEQMYYLLERTSIYYYSLVFSLQDYWQGDNSDINHPISGILENLYYRVNYISGSMLDVQKPVIGSMARFNYFKLSKKPNSPKEGSSPGLVATFTYLLPTPFNALLCIFYMVFLTVIVNAITGSYDSINTSWRASFIIMPNILILFDSPLDLLLIVDNAFITFIFILIFALYKILKASDNILNHKKLDKEITKSYNNNLGFVN